MHALAELQRGGGLPAVEQADQKDGGAADAHRTATQVVRTNVEVLRGVLGALSTDKVRLLGEWPDVVDAWADSKGPDVLEQVHGRTA